MRYSEHTINIRAGIAQGDPLSTYLYCIVMDPLLDHLRTSGFPNAAYCDDVIV